MVTQQEKGTATAKILCGISTLAEKAVTVEENHFLRLLAAKHDHLYLILSSCYVLYYISQEKQQHLTLNTGLRKQLALEFQSKSHHPTCFLDPETLSPSC